MERAAHDGGEPQPPPGLASTAMRDTDCNDILSISARLDQVTQKMEELMDRLANHYSLIEGLLARVEAVETYNRSYYQ